MRHGASHGLPLTTYRGPWSIWNRICSARLGDEQSMSWGRESEEIRRALKASLVPDLRIRGFKGSFPILPASYPSNRSADVSVQSIRPRPIHRGCFLRPRWGGGTGWSIRASAQSANVPCREVPPPGWPQPSLDFSGINAPGEATRLVCIVTDAIEGEGELWWKRSDQHHADLVPNQGDTHVRTLLFLVGFETGTLEALPVETPAATRRSRLGQSLIIDH